MSVLWRANWTALRNGIGVALCLGLGEWFKVWANCFGRAFDFLGGGLFAKEKRTAELARSVGNPIASKTCDATTEPTMQADPLEAQTPSKSSAISSVSESKPGKLTFRVFARRFTGSPFCCASEKI